MTSLFQLYTLFIITLTSSTFFTSNVLGKYHIPHNKICSVSSDCSCNIEKKVGGLDCLYVSPRTKPHCLFSQSKTILDKKWTEDLQKEEIKLRRKLSEITERILNFDSKSVPLKRSHSDIPRRSTSKSNTNTNKSNNRILQRFKTSFSNLFQSQSEKNNLDKHKTRERLNSKSHHFNIGKEIQEFEKTLSSLEEVLGRNLR